MHIYKNKDTSVVATVYSHARIVFMRMHAHAELRTQQTTIMPRLRKYIFVTSEVK